MTVKEMTKRAEIIGWIKRLAWLLFCIVALLCGMAWVFYFPSLIASDFWRGFFYPFAILMSISHAMMAVTFFWYSVLNRWKE